MMSDAIAVLQAELDKVELLRLDLETQQENNKRLSAAFRALERDLVPACKNALSYAEQQRERGHHLSGELARARLEAATLQDRLREAQTQLGEAVTALDVPLQVLDAHRFTHQGVDPYQAVSRVIGILGRVSRLLGNKGPQGRGRANAMSAVQTVAGPLALSVDQDYKGVAVIAHGGPESDEQTVGFLTRDGYLQLEPIRVDVAQRMGLQLAENHRLRVLP